MTITIAKKSGIKRIAAAILAAATLISVAACGSGNSASASKESLNTTKGKTTTITVGVCAGPYGDMVKKVIAPLLKEDGFELKTKLFNDYVQPNKALASGSIQANLFQHGNYLKKFTADNKLDLTSLGQTPTLGLGIYSKKYKSIKDIKDGSTVSIANDGSNLARSLGVLQQQGLVKLKGEVDATKLRSMISHPIRRTSKSRRSMRRSWPVPWTPSMWLWCRATTLGQPNSIRVPRSPWKSRMMV